MIGLLRRNGRVIHGVGLQRAWVPWRDPSCLCAFDADPGFYTKNGSGVSRWNDLTGNGHHALQPTAVNQPTWIEKDPDFGGHGSIQFGGVTTLRTGAFAQSMTPPTTNYVVCTFAAGGGTQVIFDGITSDRNILYQSNSMIAINAGGELSGGQFSAGTRMVMCCVFNGASSSIFVNNTANPIFAGNIYNSAPTGISFGLAFNGALPYSGKIAHMSRFARVDPPAVIARSMKHLGAKYGIITL